MVGLCHVGLYLCLFPMSCFGMCGRVAVCLVTLDFVVWAQYFLCLHQVEQWDFLLLGLKLSFFFPHD